MSKRYDATVNITIEVPDEQAVRDEVQDDDARSGPRSHDEQAEVCPKEHGNADHWTEDTYGKEIRLDCHCDCPWCIEY